MAQWPHRKPKVPELPDVRDDDLFSDLVRKLSSYFVEAIESPQTFEDLRTEAALKGQFAAVEEDDDRGVNDARGYACEVVAWRFVSHLSDRDAIDFLLYDLPANRPVPVASEDAEAGSVHAIYQRTNTANERTGLLANKSVPERGSVHSSRASSRLGSNRLAELQKQDLASSFLGLNALEIAAVLSAKKFLCQRSIQKIINGIWSGDIVFWSDLSTHSVKHAKRYNKRRADPYCRLRVPKYLKAFEVGFFASFLFFYYAVLVQRNFYTIMPVEILLYIWIAGFGYDEFGELRDAGTMFYATDFWSLWDVGIVVVGAAFFISRELNPMVSTLLCREKLTQNASGMIGLAQHNDHIIDTSFDILALEALFLIPRLCSLLSLIPYFGTLIPCLKEMTKDFIKFLSLVVILYLGFLTTFTLLARESFTLQQMSWILIKVFFGSSYLGFVRHPS
ncbi:hypothetical protein B0A49_08410 [Cryomyces minteri]|uniref:Calcium channel YVC1-like C-terminal transmembrane domain-containing protein n=1 Tax=Cryomyces minteri TaxID=331657 RepID=A0A4U0WKE5_9PEZI|nr:hypothetical protein B0A49_11462 [Cryomyces minteri]TKA63341.1 hypothetical protein B0A49_08410 [Cryomyces minteri]